MWLGGVDFYTNISNCHKILGPVSWHTIVFKNLGGNCSCHLCFQNHQRAEVEFKPHEFIRTRCFFPPKTWNVSINYITRWYMSLLPWLQNNTLLHTIMLKFQYALESFKVTVQNILHRFQSDQKRYKAALQSAHPTQCCFWKLQSKQGKTSNPVPVLF